MFSRGEGKIEKEMISRSCKEIDNGEEVTRYPHKAQGEQKWVGGFQDIMER